MYEYKCKVTRVVDGDTIDALIDLGFDVKYSSRVRLYGIDTPESRTRDKDEKVRGKLASAFLKEAVDNGKIVVLRTKLSDSRGKFGRVLASVIVDEVDINQAMIENYLAVAYFGQSKDDIESEHLVNREKLIELGKFDPSTVGK
jgi:micrococcal nuclease